MLAEHFGALVTGIVNRLIVGAFVGSQLEAISYIHTHRHTQRKGLNVHILRSLFSLDTAASTPGDPEVKLQRSDGELH